MTRKLLQAIWPLFWHPEGSDVWGDGIMFRPWNLYSRRWQQEYGDLRAHLVNLVMDP